MGLKTAFFRSVHYTILPLLVLVVLLGHPMVVTAQNPFAAADGAKSEKAPEAEAPAADEAAPAASEETANEEPASDSGSTVSVPAEESPATPEGKKSLDEYKDLLRRASARQEYEEVIKICDEIEPIYPNDESVNFFRTRAEKSIEMEATRNRIKRRATGQEDAPASSSTDAPESDVPAVAPAAAESTPEPIKTQAPPPPPAAAPAPPPVQSVQTSSGPGIMSKLFPMIVGLLLAGGGFLLVMGLFSLKKKKPTQKLPPMSDEQTDYGDHGDGNEFAQQQQAMRSPLRSPAPPPPPPPSEWDADFMGGSAAVEDDLFTPNAGSARAEANVASDIFNEPPAPKVGKVASRVEDTADQSSSFNFFDEPAKPTAPVAQVPRSEEPVSFDFDSVPPAGVATPKAAAAPKAAPWSGAEDLDSFPMLKMDAGTAPPAPRPEPAPVAPSTSTGSKAPWESRSGTATDNKIKPGSFTLPPDDESLPALDLGGATASSSSTKTKTSVQPSSPAPDFPTFGEKSGAPSFAEMNLNALKSPEFSETVVDMDFSKAADTNPGFDIQPSAPKPAPKAPELDVPQMPGDFGESTVIMSKRELSDDPDLFLQSTQF